MSGWVMDPKTEYMDDLSGLWREQMALYGYRYEAPRPMDAKDRTRSARWRAGTKKNKPKYWWSRKKRGWG